MPFHSRRTDRRPRSRLLVMTGGLAAGGGALVLAVGVPTIAGAPRLGHDDPVARGIEKQAFTLLNRAMQRNIALHGSCRPAFPRVAPTIVDGGPGPQVSSLLGVFRRPPTAVDQAASARVAAQHRPGNPFFAELPRDNARVVTTADGTRVTLVTATKLRAVGLDAATRTRCATATRRVLVQLSVHAKPVIRRAALRELDALTRREAAAAPTPATEGLEVRTGHGGGGGPFEATRFVQQPVQLSSGGPRGAARLILVVPDGVARAVLVMPRYSSRGPDRAPIDYRRPLRRSVPIADNVGTARIDGRGVEAIFGATVVEYAGDGTVVRTVRPPR